MHNIAVVRFSVKIAKYYDEIGVSKFPSREEWFADRFELFSKTLYRCLEYQTVQPNRVYILIDDSDQQLYSKYFCDVDSTVYKSVCVDSYVMGKHRDGVINYAQIIHQDLVDSGISQNVAMSRIDSDDYISYNYFEEINQAIEQNNPDVVYVSSGWLTDFETMVESVGEVDSAFMTAYIADITAQPPVDVYSRPHVSWHRDPEYRTVATDKCKWIQYIHDTNIYNHIAFQQGTQKPVDKKLFNLYFKL